MHLYLSISLSTSLSVSLSLSARLLDGVLLVFFSPSSEKNSASPQEAARCGAFLGVVALMLVLERRLEQHFEGVTVFVS